jgi:hypothetical protein
MPLVCPPSKSQSHGTANQVQGKGQGQERPGVGIAVWAATVLGILTFLLVSWDSSPFLCNLFSTEELWGSSSMQVWSPASPLLLNPPMAPHYTKGKVEEPLCNGELTAESDMAYLSQRVISIVEFGCFSRDMCSGGPKTSEFELP